MMDEQGRLSEALRGYDAYYGITGNHIPESINLKMENESTH
jgi:hypothetical protein